MEKKDLEALKKVIIQADIFSLIVLIFLFILYIVKIISIDYIQGFIIGFIALKVVFTRQYIIYSRENPRAGVNIFFNVIIYAIAMFLATIISTKALLTLGILIIIYRLIVLNKFRVLINR